ncbi:MAG: STAS domain-containing protein [Planctomycetes bacterium]|nr:STAS domain-containing protein [Planctomycetota bacterium]
MSLRNIFQVEREADTLVLTALVNLSELEYDETVTQEVYELLTDETITNLVLDFHKTDYFGSTALGFFVRLWKKTQMRGGRMAFCHVSPHELEILHITRLDEFWTICSSRAEALQVVKA